MGARGTKPVPTPIRLARGTHVPSRHGDLSLEPSGEPLQKPPEPPESLDVIGRKKWTEWGDRLAKLGLLEDRYLDALEMYCRSWDRLIYYEEQLKENGEFFVAESGYVGRHPAANGAKEARDEIRRYQIEFGLTPSSATGVKITSPQKRGVPTRTKGVG